MGVTFLLSCAAKTWTCCDVIVQPWDLNALCTCVEQRHFTALIPWRLRSVAEGCIRRSRTLWSQCDSLISSAQPKVSQSRSETSSQTTSWASVQELPKLAPPIARARFLQRSRRTPAFLKLLFPHTRQRAQARLSAFKHYRLETAAYWKIGLQSRIYRFIVKRQERSRKRRLTRKKIIQQLGGSGRIAEAFRSKDAGLSIGSSLARPGVANMPEGSGGYTSMPERGARRRKLAGYLRAANDLRQSYQTQYLGSGSDGLAEEDEASIPGAFPDASVVRSGDEEMLLFPSYARRHRKRKGPFYEPPGANEDIRGAQGSRDAEYWKRQWDKYEDDNAVVDVDIRGWVYAPNKGQMTRKNRLLVGIARHLSGVPAPSTSRPNSRPSSRASSPHRAKLGARTARSEEELAEKEAESIERRGQGEADVAWRGGYSEAPGNATDHSSLYGSPDESRSTSPDGRGSENPPLPRPVTNTSLGDEMSSRTGSKQSSWNQPSETSPADLSVANANLMLRLRPFLTTPLVQTALTVFFYNDDQSKSRTIYTNEAGHFQLRAPLDFVPTHVRVLASDKLSATEEIRITEPQGISMISDIDDTIKHSAIGSGAREIFRNAFIRDLDDLTIEGVKEWYEQMASMGVKLHYVSNAPWQLYPVLMSFFAQAGLPQGSFHLKQYTGMLQGIFEPVAERKKGTLDKIMNDFPKRRFILVGDSGEADLELYTDILLANPGRILGVFIRDVTTTQSQRFFDSSMLPRGYKAPKSPRLRGRTGGISPQLRPLENVQSNGAPPPLPPRDSATRSSSSQALDSSIQGPKMGTLIDVDDNPPPIPKLRASLTDEKPLTDRSGSVATTRSLPPTLPSKPLALRSNASTQGPTMDPVNSGEFPRLSNINHASQSTSPTSNISPNRKPAPPLPPKRGTTSPSSLSDSLPNSNMPAEPSPLSQIQTSSSLPSSSPLEPGSRATSQERQSYRTAARNKLTSAYNALPSWYSSPPPNNSPPTSSPQQTAADGPKTSRPPPPIPPRRNISSYPAAAAQYASEHLSGGWSGYNAEKEGNYSEEVSMNEGPVLSKKEELWLRRWARAKEIFDEKGVVLRSWRVGSDVAHEAVNLVEVALKEEMRNAKQTKNERV